MAITHLPSETPLLIAIGAIIFGLLASAQRSARAERKRKRSDAILRRILGD